MASLVLEHLASEGRMPKLLGGHLPKMSFLVAQRALWETRGIRTFQHPQLELPRTLTTAWGILKCQASASTWTFSRVLLSSRKLEINLSCF